MALDQQSSTSSPIADLDPLVAAIAQDSGDGGLTVATDPLVAAIAAQDPSLNGLLAPDTAASMLNGMLPPGSAMTLLPENLLEPMSTGLPLDNNGSTNADVILAASQLPQPIVVDPEMDIMVAAALAPVDPLVAAALMETVAEEGALAEGEATEEVVATTGEHGGADATSSSMGVTQESFSNSGGVPPIAEEGEGGVPPIAEEDPTYAKGFSVISLLWGSNII